MMLNRRMAQRLATAEAERDAALEAVRIATEYQQGIEARLADRAALISIVRDKRKVRLLFSRNNELTQIEAYITLDHDWDKIEKRLIR